MMEVFIYLMEDGTVMFSNKLQPEFQEKLVGSTYLPLQTGTATGTQPIDPLTNQPVDPLGIGE